jgi:shikimate dehydrogenase
MKKYAIFGNPVIHSKSPQIFNSLFKEYGQSNVYNRIKVNEASEIIDIFNQYDLSGANITSPFKEAIIPFLDGIDNISKEVNAVNTVVKKDNHYYGFNTDVYGVENAIINNGLSVKNKKCIVIGAGGAAKAAIYALKSLGASVFSTNRTDSKSLEISIFFNCNHIIYRDIENNILDTHLLVIAVPKLDINLKMKDTIILDANYNLSAFKGNGMRIVDGHDWLIHQASKTFEIFFDKLPNHLKMKQSLKHGTSRPLNIALIGMPGVGKSYYGKILAAKINKTFYDTDELIETRSKMSINDIFNNFGEIRFRNYEEEVISKLSTFENTIVAFGGGSILSQKEYFVINLHMSCDKLVNIFGSKESIDRRPLLSSGTLMKDIMSIFNNRKEYYLSLSDLTINLGDCTYERNALEMFKELLV